MVTTTLIGNMKVLVVVVFVINLLVIFTSASSIAKCSRNENQPAVELETTSGKLLGLCDFVKVNDNNPRVTRNGNVYSFLGVPYAEAPIDQNRFKAPVEVRQRTEPIDATRWPNSCAPLAKPENTSGLFSGYAMWTVPTATSPFSEDCLYLNVFLPADAYLKTNIFNYNLEPTKAPIMVFFHGGGGVRGSTAMDIYNPTTFVAATNTIVVTVNYRLGVFGGLYLDGQFPGNQALLDQTEALKWVKNNAEALGGDATKITIQGFSAGAAHVGYHLLMKDSWTLYTNAILQSGTPFIQPALSRDEATRRTRELLSSLGCTGSTDSELATCAQNAANMNNAAVDYLNKLIHNGDLFEQFAVVNPFMPVVDGRVLTDEPLALFTRGDFKRCPIMTGYLIDEGALFAGYSSQNLGEEAIRKRPSISHKDLRGYVEKLFTYYPTYPHESNPLLVDAILHEYTKIVEDESSSSKSALLKPNYFHVLSKIIGDWRFVCPAYKLIDLLARHSPNNLYLYLFAHRVSSTPWPSWYGATHGDELAFTFAHTVSERGDEAVSGNPWANPRHRYSSGEKLLANEMITYWSAFAKSGDSPNSRNNIYWPEYTLFKDDFKSDNMSDVNESVRYIIFKSTGIRVNRGYSLEICQFWNSYVDRLLKENENQMKSAKTDCGSSNSNLNSPSAVRQRASEKNPKQANLDDLANDSARSMASSTVFFSIVATLLHVFY